MAFSKRKLGKGNQYSKRRQIIFKRVEDMLAEDEFPFVGQYDWKNKSFLGQGSYGKVWKALNLSDKQFYAIKQMNMQEFNKEPTLMASLDGEIQITSLLKTPYTVQMVAYRMGRRFTYIVLELCDSDLRKELAARKITEPECVQIFDQIMKGFEVMVKQGFIHRDIKPANVLVKNGIHKVADFGFACKADILGKKKLTDICGTPIYMAPQLLRNEPYTALSDIWSLGLMLYEMIFGYTPWPCRTLEDYLQGIYSTPLRFPYNAQIGQNTRDFIVRCLVIDQGKRLSWAQAFEHPLIKHNQPGEEVRSVTVAEYTKRILLKLQNNVAKMQTNLRAIISKYKNDKINQTTFAAMLREIDLTITSHEISTLFAYLGGHKTGWLDWTEIKDKLFYVDFRAQEDVLSRKIDEVIAIIRARKENPSELFKKIDQNGNGLINFDQFFRFITELAPRYTRAQVLNVFGLLDKDKNGFVTKEELTEMVLKRMPSEPKHHLASARGLRNVKNLVRFMKENQITPEKLLQLGEHHMSEGLKRAEFQHLMNFRLNFKITQEEIDEVFYLIDKSENGVVTIDELIAVLKQP